MVSCKHCSTQNSLDSTFCKRCGTSIDEVALTDAQTKLDGLIEEGNALFNQGRTEEAMAVADACVLSNPSSVSALSLKVLCHERRGEIAEALECAERIIELNPDSELDKIKRNALRTRLQADLRVPEPPDRKLALVGAAAAVVLVACLGIGIARITSRPTADNLVVQRTPGTNETYANPVNPDLGANVANQGGTGAVTPPANNQAATTNNPPQTANNQNQVPRPDDVPAIGTRNETPRPRATSFPNIQLPGATTSLPEVDTSATEPFRVNPDDVRVVPEGGQSGVARPRQSSQNGGGEEPKPLETSDRGTTTPTQPVSEQVDDSNKGIEIEVRQPRAGGSRAPGGMAPMSGNGLETLLRVGSEQYQLGNYAAAGRSYEQALRAGGDSIILNQRIGQAYSRLGRNNEAADAYRRCISACEAAIANGTGNRARHEAVKATAEQALKVLQGG